jgi:hypothetical protein
MALHLQENRYREAAAWKNVIDAFIDVMKCRVVLTKVPRFRRTGLS